MISRFLTHTLVVLGIVTGLTVPGFAQGIDVDYDALLAVIDGLQEAALENNPSLGPNDVLFLDRDNDNNGIPDRDQFAMLSAILRGTYSYESSSYGTNQLTPATVSAIQQGFTANKVRVETDMTVGGSTCFLFGLAGIDCNLIEALSPRWR